jgi:hypothetical protein
MESDKQFCDCKNKVPNQRRKFEDKNKSFNAEFK